MSETKPKVLCILELSLQVVNASHLHHLPPGSLPPQLEHCFLPKGVKNVHCNESWRRCGRSLSAPLGMCGQRRKYWDKPDWHMMEEGSGEGPVCLWGVFGVSLGPAAAFSFNHVPQPGQRPQVLDRCVMGSNTELSLSLCREVLGWNTPNILSTGKNQCFAVSCGVLLGCHFSSVILDVRSLLVSLAVRFGPYFGHVNLVYMAHCPISGGGYWMCIFTLADFQVFKLIQKEDMELPEWQRSLDLPDFYKSGVPSIENWCFWVCWLNLWSFCSLPCLRRAVEMWNL